MAVLENCHLTKTLSNLTNYHPLPWPYCGLPDPTLSGPYPFRNKDTCCQLLLIQNLPKFGENYLGTTKVGLRRSRTLTHQSFCWIWISCARWGTWWGARRWPRRPRRRWRTCIRPKAQIRTKQHLQWRLIVRSIFVKLSIKNLKKKLKAVKRFQSLTSTLWSRYP